MKAESPRYSPSSGWPQNLLSAGLGCVFTWLALAARGDIEPHAGWRHSVRALASTPGSCTARSWPAKLRADPAGADLSNATAVVPVATVAKAGSWSQGGEDMHAYTTYFHGMREGIYLEMGALDGRQFSNTQLFDTFLDWKGVLVEPSPKNFEHLVVNRPNAVQVNAAICGSSTVVHYVDASTADALHAINGIREFMSDQFKSNWAGYFDKAEVTEVACVPLSKLLADLGLTHVNFFSLDVEGAELSVMETVDFQRVKFDVVVVEADGTDQVKDQKVVDLFTANGYIQCGNADRNNWFMREDFVPSKQLGAS